MSKNDHLHDQLSIAFGAARQADRTWRAAMKHDARSENKVTGDLGQRRLLDGLWRDRESAKRNVELLRTAVAEAHQPGRPSSWFRTLPNKRREERNRAIGTAA